ncbi:MAG: transporter [Thiotrichaceae bacterium]|nr:transporter [Thiotrichaceae bacterium]
MKVFKKFSFVLLTFSTILHAHTLEPKLYANLPIGLNVLLVGYGHSEGAIPENTSLGLTDPNLNINSTFLVYGRTFDVLGHNTKFDIIIPYSSIYGTALHNGTPVTRDVQGMGDTKARVSFNLFGAPALSLQEFASYQPDTVLGVSLQVTMPTGQYDSSKLINISTHRWAIKPGVGISKSIKDFTFEFSADAEFYTSNNNFFGGIKRTQDPIYSTQVHVLYKFRRAMWLSIGANYYWGGEYFNDAIGADNTLKNTRIGATFALPINKHQSIKLYGNRGINTRYGTDFDAIGIAWQYNWAD